MRRIDRIASTYRARGHGVKILSARRLEVRDSIAGNVYRVTAYGRAVVGSELASELAAEAVEEPPTSEPGCARLVEYPD